MDAVTTPQQRLLGYSLKKNTEIKEKAGIRCKIEIQITAKSEENNGQDKVKAKKVIKEETQINASKVRTENCEEAG